MVKKTYELLAPANNKQTAFVAINSGADAVYIGYKTFGARAQAGNSLEDIIDVINYAHIFRVKVYITLNTLFFDKEIKSVEEIIKKLYNANADGIIIQDMGLLECKIPPIPIIASTQCHNNKVEKIHFLEKTGFQRVILPREMSFDEIKEISKSTNVELEAFVHGALCVSYSGQCYLSWFLGKRSANRGQCAQPCRKRYTLKTQNGKIIAKNKYLLSMKDFNLSDKLEDLINSGITSFKIEGRLKDENYVKNVVLFYRQKLDRILKKNNLEKSSVGTVKSNYTPDLNKTFNREYTDFFTESRNKFIPTIDYPNMRGEFVGEVVKVNKNCFVLSSNLLHNADGICFYNKTGELIGTHVNRTDGNIVYPLSMTGIEKGLKIYRNFDKQFSDVLQKENPKRVIQTDLKIARCEKSLMFVLSDKENNCAVLIYPDNFEAAKNQDSAIMNIHSTFQKLKDTEFEIDKITINLKSIPFIPLSKLNSIRRQLIDKLQVLRAKNYPQSKRLKDINLVEYPIKSLNFKGNILNGKAKLFYEKRGVEIKEPAAESGIILAQKPVMTTKYCLRYQLGLCKKQTPKFKDEKLILIDEDNREFDLSFNCSECLMEIKPR